MIENGFSIAPLLRLLAILRSARLSRSYRLRLTCGGSGFGRGLLRPGPAAKSGLGFPLVP